MTKVHKKAWPRKNLDELITFIENQHGHAPSLEEISQKTGLTIANISALFMRDDMKLSRAEGIVRAYGYELKLFFPLKEYPIEWNTRRDFPNAGNLTGLVKYMYDSNIAINSLSKRVGRSSSMITKAFTTGDIFLSGLYQILEKLNIDVLWIFENIN